jgi:hypothetical protein
LGLYYYEARFYSPTIWRFLQTDPTGTKDDLNLYAYVGKNPVNRVDPTALAKVDVGRKTPTRVAATGGCRSFSGGCQNGASYGTTAAYEIDKRCVCTDGVVKFWDWSTTSGRPDGDFAIVY